MTWRARFNWFIDGLIPGSPRYVIPRLIRGIEDGSIVLPAAVSQTPPGSPAQVRAEPEGGGVRLTILGGRTPGGEARVELSRAEADALSRRLVELLGKSPPAP